ncbi:hypothetical protein B0T26DRAFT_600168, partial [Lasiosphaeria miniovina]
APAAVFKKRGAKGKANIRKRPATPPLVASDDSSDFSSSEDDSGLRVKRRKNNTGVGTAVSRNKAAAAAATDVSSATIFEADRGLGLDSNQDATKSSNWFDEDVDGALSAKSLLGSTRALQSKKSAGSSSVEAAQDPPDGTYKGLANQTSYIQKNPNAPSRIVGPVKVPTNIRTITITDMAPDVCKDYKTTGFCGFGDSCKFLHARENYLHGWQLDKEWENVTKGKKTVGGTIVASADRRNRNGADNNDDDRDAEEEAMLENIPFACFICKGPYKAPVVTRCGHYFCEACALNRYRCDPGCAACGMGTNGVFNSAKKLQKLLEKKKERAARKRQEAIEAGEDVSEEEED